MVPYRYGVDAGLATITASFSPASPVTGSGSGRGTTPTWTTTNAVRVTVQCSGATPVALATVPVQSSVALPGMGKLESATPGNTNCTLIAYNSDNEPVTQNIAAAFVDPAPPTITASF